MSEIFLTSDSHFGHQKDFLWGPRGFTSSEEHDEAIIENWNKIVKPDDLIYHLGDVMLGDNEHGMECLKRLNGTIWILLGNHDSAARTSLYNTLPNVKVLGYADIIKCGKWRFYLAHYPTMIGNFDESNPKFWALCGHRHTKDKWCDVENKCYHVELDCHDNKPVNIEEIIEDLRGYNR